LPTEFILMLRLTSVRQLNLPYCVTPSLKCQKVVQEYLTCFPSSIPIGLDLGYRLTLSGWTVLTEPLGFQRTGISPVFSLLIPTFSLLWSDTCLYSQACIYQRTLPYPCIIHASHSFGDLFSPVRFQRKNTWLVSYYAFFKGLLLLSQPPSCLCDFTSFST
jgi:hypothetical protein